MIPIKPENTWINYLILCVVLLRLRTGVDLLDGIRLLPKTRPSNILQSLISIFISIVNNFIIFAVGSFLETMPTCKGRYRPIFCWFTISDAAHQYHIGNITTKRPILVLRAVINSWLNHLKNLVFAPLTWQRKNNLLEDKYINFIDQMLQTFTFNFKSKKEYQHWECVVWYHSFQLIDS